MTLIGERLAAMVGALSASGGALIDRLLSLVRDDGRPQVAFTVAIIALAAKMAKADGVVTQDEEKAFFTIFTFSPSEERNVKRLFDLAKKDMLGFHYYAQRLGQLFADDEAMREDILDGLFHIACADGFLHEDEIGFLRQVAQILGIGEDMFSAILARNSRGRLDPYQLLSISPTASDQEIKSRYRALVNKSHPDRMIARGVPEQFLKLANDRLAKLNIAYEQILLERNSK